MSFEVFTFGVSKFLPAAGPRILSPFQEQHCQIQALRPSWFEKIIIFIEEIITIYYLPNDHLKSKYYDLIVHPKPSIICMAYEIERAITPALRVSLKTDVNIYEYLNI